MINYLVIEQRYLWNILTYTGSVNNSEGLPVKNYGELCSMIPDLQCGSAFCGKRFMSLRESFT